MFFSHTLDPSKNRGKLTARCENESPTVENEFECLSIRHFLPSIRSSASIRENGRISEPRRNSG